MNRQERRHPKKEPDVNLPFTPRKDTVNLIEQAVKGMNKGIEKKKNPHSEIKLAWEK